MATWTRLFTSVVAVLLLSGAFLYSEFALVRTTKDGGTVYKVIHTEEPNNEETQLNEFYKNLMANISSQVTLAVAEAVAAAKRIGPTVLYDTNRTFVKTPKDYQFLLQKKFYVYEELIWLDATMGGRLVVDLLEEGFTYKHAEDLWFMASSLSHPMRTFDPKEAEIFVVPTLGSQAVTTHKKVKLCYNGLCSRKLLKRVEEHVLMKSPWFQRKNGSDHIFVATDYMAPRVMHSFPYLQRCHMIVIENRQYNNLDRFALPSFYMGSPCPTTNEQGFAQNKTSDFVFVGTLFPHNESRPTFRHRKNICNWMPSDRPNYKMDVCGIGEQCPALSQAKFGFHARGDSWGANRLIDTILSETVPIFTAPELYMTLPDWIDWKQLSLYAPASKQKDFLTSLDDHMTNTAEYEKKLAAVRANKDLFEWRSGIPFDTYMFMLGWHLDKAAGLQPVTPTSPFSALRMPTVVAPSESFNVSSKRKWCGYGGMAHTCAQCNGGKWGKRLCTSSCHFCPNGTLADPNTTLLCVDNNVKCYKP